MNNSVDGLHSARLSDSQVSVALDALTIRHAAGGIENNGTLTVTNSTFSGNIAGGIGGGIDNGSTAR